MPRPCCFAIFYCAASSNYPGPEDVDVVLTCVDNVAPFLVELLVKRQSAHVTCIAGACVAKSIGIGPGGSLKIRNGNVYCLVVPASIYTVF